MRAREIQDLADLTREVEVLVTETNLIWWFRGHSSTTWDLIPSARRGYTTEQERYFSNDFLFERSCAIMRFLSTTIMLAGWH